MKRIITYSLMITLILSIFTYKAMAKGPVPLVSADSVVLMNAETGTVIYSKNMNTPYPPASTTKLMTALLTLENCNLEDKVIVGKKPPNADGSSIYILEGEELTVKDLLHGLILASGNDCAEALAEHISGSTEEFAKLMNKRAKELGCETANFVNPHGLYDPNHKASAKDLALIMRELTKHQEYFAIATKAVYKIPPTNKSVEERVFSNGNKLVKNTEYKYPPCDGGKTGYTVQSKHSYVATATKNGQRLIVALVHDENKTFFQDAINLFEYGFNNYELAVLFKKSDFITTYKLDNKDVPLLAAEDFYYVKEKGTDEAPQFKLPEKDLDTTSFKAGEDILEAEVTLNNKKIGILKLTSSQDHVVSSLNVKTLVGSTTFSKNNVIIAIAAVLVLFLITASLRLRKKRI